MKKIIIASVTAIVVINLAQAQDSDNDCQNLHIQISNLTKSVCVLTSQAVIHGTLITPPPLSILPNDSKRFDMSQTVYGPAIKLNYQCGTESISFTSQQNYCVFEAGDINGSLLHPLPVNINAKFTALTGSFLWMKAGSINWTILSNV